MQVVPNPFYIQSSKNPTFLTKSISEEEILKKLPKELKMRTVMFKKKGNSKMDKMLVLH